MIRNLKFLGVALIAALAMSSVVASMASADRLTSEAVATTLTGAQEGADVFKVDGGEVKCTTTKYHGALASASVTQVTVTPTYSGCTFAGLATTVNVNGCDYLITFDKAPGKEGKEATPEETKALGTTGKVDIVCPAGKEITVTAPSVGTAKCIIHVPPQGSLAKVTGANLGAGTTREVTLTIAIAGIAYSQTAGTAETGNCATADGKVNGTYTGSALVTGETTTSEEIGGKQVFTHIGIFLSS